MSVRQKIAKKLNVTPEQVQMGISERWVRLISVREGTHKEASDFVNILCYCMHYTPYPRHSSCKHWDQSIPLAVIAVSGYIPISNCNSRNA